MTRPTPLSLKLSVRMGNWGLTVSINSVSYQSVSIRYANRALPWPECPACHFEYLNLEESHRAMVQAKV